MLARFAIILCMKTEDPSDRDVLIDLAAVTRMFMQLVDVHRFGDWRIFLDGEEPNEPDFSSYDPENTPPWIIHREDLVAIGTLHKQLVKAIVAADIPMEGGAKSEGFLVFVGGCIVSKVIMLVHCLLLSYNYYKVKTIPYPGRAASSYLNPEIVPDLRDALALTVFILFKNFDRSHPYLRTSILSNLYAMMKILFDVLYGMLPCEEVVRLREAYDVFHAAGGEGETFGLFFAQLRAVSRRFAAEEPKWERERAESTYTNPAPVVANAAAFAPLAAAGRRPRKRIPVKVAAAIFETHPNTIGNWDKGKGRPPEYLGRDVDEELLRASAAAYFRRRHNEEQAKRNWAEGLTYRSAAPVSETDSTRLEHDHGNYRISTENGRRTPL